MNKKYKLLKIFIIFLMTSFSMHIFIFNLKIIQMNNNVSGTSLYKFYLSLWVSMKEFDIIWIIFFIFIYYYFYSNYFLDSKWNKTKTISSIISIIITLTIIVSISLINYHNLNMITKSFTQIYKCLMVGIGYYLIIYIIARNILTSIRKNNKNEK